MKKIGFILFMVTMLLTGIGSYGISEALDTAGQDPLIDILIKKGILTKEEAADIKKEAEALEKQSQKEIVKEIKDKELAVPKALTGLKVGMLAYLDYSNGQNRT